MIPVLSQQACRAFDQHAIERAHVPGIVLMENAGRGAADVIERECLGGQGAGHVVAIVCGVGNNGGDGFVVARHLLLRGATVRVALVGALGGLTGDAAMAHGAFVGVGGSVVQVKAAHDVRALLDGATVVVDALFGTGLSRPIEGMAGEVVGVLSAGSAKVVALDVPSGISANTGRPLGKAVVADLTVTFAHWKAGLLTPSGARHAGKVCLVDIGVPAPQASTAAKVGLLVELTDIRARLSARSVSTHKTLAGHVGIIGGHPGRLGAAVLCGRGALRTGAGLVTVTSRASSEVALPGCPAEFMTESIDGDDIPASIVRAMVGRRSLVVGPGLGIDDKAWPIVSQVYESFAGPVVVDADALTLISSRYHELTTTEAAGAGRILTPHPGEAARLLGVKTEAVEADRFEAVRVLSLKHKAVVVLKGPHSIISAPDGRLHIGPRGTPALATAGSGDVLAGIIAALACELPPMDAATVGVYLHAMAGAHWAAEHGDRGMMAGEIADRIPAVLKDILGA